MSSSGRDLLERNAAPDAPISPQDAPRSETSRLSLSSAAQPSMQAMSIRRWLSAVVVLSFSAAGICWAGEAVHNEPMQAQKYTFVFRFDDYPNKQKEVQEQLIRLFVDKDTPVTIAVIPDRLAEYSPSACEFLRTLQDSQCEIALHGFSHRSHAPKRAHPSEFHGLPQDKQQELVAAGLNVFRDALHVSPWTFVPPANSYDETTVRVLEESGIRCLSAGVGLCAAPLEEIDHRSLLCLPASCDLFDLRYLLSEDRLSPGLYVVLTHIFDYYESGDDRAFISIEGLAELLSTLRKFPGASFHTVSGLTGSDPSAFGRTRLAAAQAFEQAATDRVFAFPRHWVTDAVGDYKTVEQYATETRQVVEKRRKLRLLASAPLVASTVTGFALGVASRKRRLFRGISFCLMGLAVAGVCALIARNTMFGSGFGWKDRIALTGGLCFVVGGFISHLVFAGPSGLVRRRAEQADDSTA